MRMLAAATAGFTILPPATTYERVWKATRPLSLGYTLWDAQTQIILWRKEDIEAHRKWCLENARAAWLTPFTYPY